LVGAGAEHLLRTPKNAKIGHKLLVVQQRAIDLKNYPVIATIPEVHWQIAQLS
jgi:hypothetical protein